MRLGNLWRADCSTWRRGVWCAARSDAGAHSAGRHARLSENTEDSSFRTTDSDSRFEGLNYECKRLLCTCDAPEHADSARHCAVDIERTKERLWVELNAVFFTAGGTAVCLDFRLVATWPHVSENSFPSQ